MDIKSLLQQISSIFVKLSLKQKIVSGLSLLVVIGFLVFLSLYKSKNSDSDGYSVLFDNISPSDSALIIDHLNKEGVDYKLINEDSILVPNDEVYKQRIAVASLGIPKNSKIGFEIFDKQDFGSTDLDQRIKAQRAIQGELDKTIESLGPIKKASVRIAFPKESVFTERQSPPTASVLLIMNQGKSLSQKQIFGIKNLVAASVTNLNINNVKIVNQDGIALGEENDGFDSDLIASQMRYKKEFENNYEQKIINVIAPIVGGINKVVAKVTIDFDFDKKDSKSEIYDPNNVVRSESNIEEKRQGKNQNQIGGVPGAVSNIGPVQGIDDNKIVEQYNKSSTQTNYEISKKITNIKGQFATIKRLSAAVVVDGYYKNEKDDNGDEKLIYIPLSDLQKTSITNLIKQAIGYQASRGDEVSLDNFEFKSGQKISSTQKVNNFMHTYVTPFLPIFKYIFAVILLYIFYKKVVVVFMQKMLEETKEDEYSFEEDLGDIDLDTEDSLEKYKASRKKVEEQLGINKDFNEDELKYEVLLEKMKAIIQERDEEISNLLQEMIKNDSDFNLRKEF